MNTFRIIQDSREQNPFSFDFEDDCIETIVRKLDVGDYSMLGYEDILCVERKASTGEIAGDFGKYSARWNKKIGRMSKFQFKYLICEFTLEDVLAFPHKSKIPGKVWPHVRISANYLVSCLEKCERLGIEIIYCENHEQASECALEIFRYVRKTIDASI